MLRKSTARPAWIDPTSRHENNRPWDVKNAPALLSTLQRAKRTDERLHAASTLRKCSELPSSHEDLLKPGTSFLQTILWVMSLPSTSPATKRCQLHLLHCLRNVSGREERTDAMLCHDDGVITMLWTVVTAAVSHPPDEMTVTAMATLGEYAKREINQPLLCHADGFVPYYVDLLTSSPDGHIVFHALSTISSLSNNPRNHFVLARNGQLLKVLTLILDSCDADPDRCKVGLRLLANLMAYPENCTEILRTEPNVLECLLRLADRDPSAAPRGEDPAQDETAKFALGLLELCQDYDADCYRDASQEPIEAPPATPAPPLPTPHALPDSSEGLQQFIDKRIHSLETMYGTSQWAAGPAPSLPQRWV